MDRKLTVQLTDVFRENKNLSEQLQREMKKLTNKGR